MFLLGIYFKIHEPLAKRRILPYSCGVAVYGLKIENGNWKLEQKGSDPPANARHWRAGHCGLSDNTIIDSTKA